MLCARLMPALLATASLIAAGNSTLEPLRRVTDLDPTETAKLELADGSIAELTLLSVKVRLDPIREAVREATVVVKANGETATLFCGNYHLPVTVGRLQLDCPVTRDYYSNSNQDHWALTKAARIRIWPAGSAWVRPGTFRYPARQAWFASRTQMANEPTYVDGGELASERKIYYHSGLDIGGAEGLVPVVSATNGQVVSRGGDVMPEYQNDSPVEPRYDVVYIRDARGWFYRYSHLQSIDPDLQLGGTVRMDEPIGILGKEGGSGGWSHLHFEIKARQPSGRWGTEEGYAFLWAAYQRQFGPVLLAVARPHHLIHTGSEAVLDGSLSAAPDAKITSYEWTFSDGGHAAGAQVRHRYAEPGTFSEILKVTDSRGRVAYDFATVQVQKQGTGPALNDAPPTLHAAFFPNQNLKPGQPITFKARTFRTQDGEEAWDFGDGTPSVRTRSDGNAVKLAEDGYAVTTHTYKEPGDYLVRVERANARGEKAIARLWVQVAR